MTESEDTTLKLTQLMVFTALMTSPQWAQRVSSESVPVLEGTINVVVANQGEMVVLTDSRLSTKTGRDAQGKEILRTVTDSAQKLFRLDDHTVCTFAGFASVPTPSIPEYLNNVPAIMGRYSKALKTVGASTIEEKLELLQGVFTNYLSGTANLDYELVPDPALYYTELFLAGYDNDGSVRVASLILHFIPQTTYNGGTLLAPVVIQRKIWTVGREPFVVVHGMHELADQMLQEPSHWANEPALAAYDTAKKHKESLTIDQMKKLAIFLKEQTAATETVVGGQAQIAVLTKGRIQSLDPTFPPPKETDSHFVIMAGGEYGAGDISQASGIAVHVGGGLYPLFFKALFTHTQQSIDDSFYSGNTFRESKLLYAGRKLQFETSNKIIDSDLVLFGLRRDCPEVQYLINNFKWRNIESQPPKALFPWESPPSCQIPVAKP